MFWREGIAKFHANFSSGEPGLTSGAVTDEQLKSDFFQFSQAYSAASHYRILYHWEIPLEAHRRVIAFWKLVIILCCTRPPRERVKQRMWRFWFWWDFWTIAGEREREGISFHFLRCSTSWTSVLVRPVSSLTLSTLCWVIIISLLSPTLRLPIPI